MGTLMRQDWSPLTFGKEKSKPRPGTSKQFNIPINEYRCVYQKTLKHNFGKSSSKDHQLTVTGWRSGISSAVNLTVHTEFHHLQWDFVAANPSDLKNYRASQPLYDRLMRGFQHLCGDDDPGLPPDDEDDDDLEPECAHGLILMKNNILPLTAVQLDVMWWILRAFCFTSSTSAKKYQSFRNNHYC